MRKHINHTPTPTCGRARTSTYTSREHVPSVLSRSLVPRHTDAWMHRHVNTQKRKYLLHYFLSQRIYLPPILACSLPVASSVLFRS